MSDQTIQRVELSKIFENGHNPRQSMNQDSIKDLAENISVHGLLNPLLLRPGKKGMYEVVAGHRRFNAVKLLDWKEVNCLVKTLTGIVKQWNQFKKCFYSKIFIFGI